MKVYLASWFASKEEMSIRAIELRAAGIEVTARWLDEKVKSTAQIKDVSQEYLTETAVIDIQDILQSDTVVLNTPSPEQLKAVDMPVSSWARGGRHFEAGFQYATMMFLSWLPIEVQAHGNRRLIIVGHRENVFHHLDELKGTKVGNITLPEIKCFAKWKEAKDYLIKTYQDDAQESTRE